FIAPDHYGWSRSIFTYIGPVNYVEVACWFGLPALALALGAAATSVVRRSPEEQGADAAKLRALIVFALVLAAVALPLAFAFPPVVHLVEAL
ncbi:MAG: hypothetical protein GTO31_11460, partial [Xanthomonadales bacterium]|nr:hypothetical protein [Xanthomonadales bacterium]